MIKKFYDIRSPYGIVNSREVSLTMEKLFILTLFVLISCSQFFPTDIKDILDNPREYDGKTVTISGEVTESINLIILKYFSVKDKTGEIIVVTEKSVPKSGESVKITGVVNQAFAIENKSLVVILEKDK